jgi:hypothetical protein
VHFQAWPDAALSGLCQAYGRTVPTWQVVASGFVLAAILGTHILIVTLFSGKRHAPAASHSQHLHHLHCGCVLPVLARTCKSWQLPAGRGPSVGPLGHLKSSRWCFNSHMHPLLSAGTPIPTKASDDTDPLLLTRGGQVGQKVSTVQHRCQHRSQVHLSQPYQLSKERGFIVRETLFPGLYDSSAACSLHTSDLRMAFHVQHPSLEWTSYNTHFSTPVKGGFYKKLQAPVSPEIHCMTNHTLHHMTQLHPQLVLVVALLACISSSCASARGLKQADVAPAIANVDTAKAPIVTTPSHHVAVPTSPKFFGWYKPRPKAAAATALAPTTTQPEGVTTPEVVASLVVLAAPSNDTAVVLATPLNDTAMVPPGTSPSISARRRRQRARAMRHQAAGE